MGKITINLSRRLNIPMCRIGNLITVLQVLECLGALKYNDTA